MSILTKMFDFRADAIVTDCFVVMPEGVKDNDGNRKYCHIENAAWDTGATNTIISPEIVKVLGLNAISLQLPRYILYPTLSE